MGVITFLPEVFCNGSFKDYVNVNASDIIISNMTDKLCNLTTATKQLDMTKLFLEEMDLDKLVHLVIQRKYCNSKMLTYLIIDRYSKIHTFINKQSKIER